MNAMAIIAPAGGAVRAKRARRFANEAIVYAGTSGLDMNTSAKAKNCVCVFAGAVSCHCSEVNTSVKMHTDDACVKRFENEAIVCMQAPADWT